MAWLADFPSADAAQQRAELALRWPVGAVSPLWAMFGAAASAGVAYWWMTRWTEMVNIEAFAGALATPAAKAAAEPLEVVAELATAPEVEAEAVEAEPVAAQAVEAAVEVVAPAAPPEAPPVP